MNRFIKPISIIVSLVLLLSSIISIWFLISNLRPIISIISFLPIILSISAIMFAKLFFPDIIARVIGAMKSTTKKWGNREKVIICLSIILVGLLVRLLIFYQFEYEPVSDPRQFFKTAKLIADGTGIMGKSYQALFPYLVAYTNLLGGFMKFITDPWLATIILNYLFDIFAAVFAFLFIRRITNPGSVGPVAVFSLWILSPFSILFSTLSLPIPVVNFFIIVGIYLVHLLSTELLIQNTKRVIVYAVILGLTFGIANWFRPVFPVFLVALFIYLLYLTITNKYQIAKVAILSALTLFVVVSIFFMAQRFNTSLVSSQTGYRTSDSSGGWSIYVGANKKHNGGWNRSDSAMLANLIKEKNYDFKEIHHQLTRDGIERYKSYGVLGSLNLFGRKLYKFSSNQNILTNMDTSVVGYSNSRVSKLFDLYILVFTSFIFAASTYYLYIQSRINLYYFKKFNPIILFVSLILLGFFFSSMFVEVANRYAQIMYPLFIITTALFLNNLWKVKQ